MMRQALAAAVVSLAACSSSDEGVSTPYHEVFREDDRTPAKSSGWCQRCNFTVYDGHRCGRTIPCALCQREAGARHMHEVQWLCEQDDLVHARQHECLDAKNCTTCRNDRRSLLGPIGCERCFRMIGVSRVHGLTTYCGTCDQEIGANHICGKTVYCRPCLREAGGGHKCDATRLCMEHEREHAPDHVHGTTRYCIKCHRDAGEGHKHGVTEWCWRCNEEMEWPHCHHG
jgi:hypothetical protein